VALGAGRVEVALGGMAVGVALGGRGVGLGLGGTSVWVGVGGMAVDVALGWGEAMTTGPEVPVSRSSTLQAAKMGINTSIRSRLDSDLRNKESSLA
jgi:hypothetical protein